MKIESTGISSWSLPLKQPLLLERSRISVRKGLLIRLTDQTGRIGWGDIAPLPGFSVESIEQAIGELRLLGRELSECELSDESILESTAERPLPHLQLAPSVRFGFEMALWNLVAGDKAQSAEIKVKVNGLIVGLDESAISRAEELAQSGYQSIKLKVGRTGDRKEAELIRELARKLPDDMSLRLDGNRAFDLSRAVAFCHELAGCRIEYIEEPLADPSGLPELAKQTSIPLALDESLAAVVQSTDNEPSQEETLLRLIESTSIAAMVIKPTLVGGIHQCLRLARLAGRVGVTVVISSAYESSLGIASLACLADNVSPGTAHGLATLDVFEKHLTDQRPLIKSGNLIFPAGFSFEPNLSLTKEINYE